MSKWLARKRLFLRQPPDEDPQWALKFSSDVCVMDRDTRTDE